MRASRFTQLANHLGVQHVKAFSQTRWRNHVYVWDPGNLCSGLCYVWLIKKLENQSLLNDLETEHSLPYFGFLLDEIHRLQKLSYYPDFPKDYTPNQADLKLFVSKYGTSDWQGITRLVQQEYQGNYVLYDLSSNYDFEDANIIRFSSMPDFVNQATFQGSSASHITASHKETGTCSAQEMMPSSAVLGVFRFGRDSTIDIKEDKPVSGMSILSEGFTESDKEVVETTSGHQFVYYLDKEGVHHFFDPNAGEVIESDSDRFFTWLNLYLSAADFSRNRALPSVPFLTLYQLQGLSCRTARATCSSRKAS